MSNTKTTFSTSVIKVPAHSCPKYGNNESSPNNYYSASATMAKTPSGQSATVEVRNGWQSLGGGWYGPTFQIVNNGDQEITCNLQVISIGPEEPNLEFKLLG